MKIHSLPLILLAFCTCGLFAQTDTSFYSVVAKDKITGAQKIWKTGSNEYHYTYHYNDRGRGDSLATTLHTTDDRLILSETISGVDYFKNSYSESFTVVGDSAIWTVNGTRKSKPFKNASYLSSEAPTFWECLIPWTLQQPAQRATLLPDGFVHLDAPLFRSFSLQGKTQKLLLYPVYFEPEPAPTYIWMTDDMHFFASINAWTSCISKGYETWTDTLLSIQETAGQKYYVAELNANSKPLAHLLLLNHCNVFQSSTATVLKDMSVEVVDGKIASLFPTSSTIEHPKPDTTIDCKGKFLMPGLWDMHAHYGKEEGVKYLAGGVTHVRDMGNDNIILTYKKQIEENKLLGPDLTYLSGFIDKEDPFQGPTGAIIKSLSEGIAAIDDYHRRGYQQIKLYSSITPAWVKPLAAHAHESGMKVCGHIPAFMTAEQAINDGYNEITHMNFIFLNFMSNTIDTRTPARFRMVGDHGGELDLKSKKVRDFVQLMKAKHIALDPTLNVWQGMFDEFKGDTSHALKPIISWLPLSMLSGLSNQSPFGSEEQKKAYQAAFRNMLKMTKLLYDNGILLVSGTDGGEAIALHHELELYVQAGIPANQVLKIGTYNAALDCNLQNTWGSIAVGREADFILVDGNPIQNISDIRRVELVVKNKRMYQPRELLTRQGWKYY